MNKLLLVILFGLHFSTFAATLTHHQSADRAAQHIIDTSIQNMIALHKQHTQVTNAQVIDLIKKKFVPFIDIEYSASQALKKEWSSLNATEKQALSKYIINSLIQEYSSFLTTYKDINQISIVADPNIKQRDNRAIVILVITTPSKKTIEMAIKMIYQKSWKIYDIVISGVSLISSYEQQFNSFIRRKGFEAFKQHFLY